MYLGELNIMEVGAELLYVASRIDVKELERFVGHTSGLVELLFSWNAHTPAAVRAQRMEWLSEEVLSRRGRPVAPPLMTARRPYTIPSTRCRAPRRAIRR